jgi:hypothetical protein
MVMARGGAGPAASLGGYLAPAPTLVPAGRPRQRLWSLGPAALTTAELLAILLGTGSGGAEVLEVAGRPPVQRIREPEDVAHLF